MTIFAAFRSRVKTGHDDEFQRRYRELSLLVADIPGYLGHKNFIGDDGENCLIVEFATDDAFEAWDTHPDHKAAKMRGKEAIFETYDVKVGKAFEHHHKP